jgi:putative endonuclease
MIKTLNDHNELGKLGRISCRSAENGYAILETNWTFKSRNRYYCQNILAVVEVKTRSSLDFGLPQDFVKPKKYNYW